jgi:hypothetical protein
VQPVAAAQPAPEPAPVPQIQEASTTDAPAAEPVTAEGTEKVLRDSRGVDCKVKDLSRSESDLKLCKSVIKTNGGGGGYGGGSKSTGSQRWQ